MLQIGAPVFLTSLQSTDPPVQLETLRNSTGETRHHDEAFVRDLIHRSPRILPISEIEPIFDQARSICIELPNPAGFADNLLVTPEGGIVLVECKLQRNLQARREVIAQIMDYAAQLQSWTFEELDAAVRRAELPDGGKPRGLVECFDDHDDFDSIAFMDAVTRNLRRGRMLLLVVGDGIREGLESLAGIIQRHPGFHAALGLIELKIFPLPQGGFIVQPRTLLRTLNIERGVVTFSDDRLAITPPPILAENERVSAAGKRPASLTEEEFYTILASECPEAPPAVKSLVQKLENLGLAPEFKRSLIMRWTGADGRLHNIINILKTGRIKFEALSWQLQTEAELATADAYRQSIADAVGGEVRGLRSNSSNGRNVWIGDKLIAVDDLRQHEDVFMDAVERLLHQFHEWEQNRERLL
jgi:hypothetical protein